MGSETIETTVYLLDELSDDATEGATFLKLTDHLAAYWRAIVLD